MFSDMNISPTFSTFTIIGYSTTTPMNNKIVHKNSILQHNSVIAEYSDSLTDDVTVL